MKDSRPTVYCHRNFSSCELMYHALAAVDTVKLAKQREDRLALAEYELRIAKEDLQYHQVRRAGPLRDVCGVKRGLLYWSVQAVVTDYC